MCASIPNVDYIRTAKQRRKSTTFASGTRNQNTSWLWLLCATIFQSFPLCACVRMCVCICVCVHGRTFFGFCVFQRVFYPAGTVSWGSRPSSLFRAAASCGQQGVDIQLVGLVRQAVIIWEVASTTNLSQFAFVDNWRRAFKRAVGLHSCMGWGPRDPFCRPQLLQALWIDAGRCTSGTTSERWASNFLHILLSYMCLYSSIFCWCDDSFSWLNSCKVFICD